MAGMVEILTVILSSDILLGMLWPPDERRNLGMYLLAYKGSGKSRLMGRVICLSDLLRGIPQLVIDGVGGLIDNVLDTILRLPPAQRRTALKRLRYFDMSGRKYTSHVCPLPLFYRLGQETWADIAARYLDTVIALDNQLANAPILGANALWHIGLPTNMILAASGWQISEALALLNQPRQYKAWLKTLAQTTSDRRLLLAIDFYRQDYMGWDGKKRSTETGSYQRKLELLLRDNAALACFGAAQPGFDLHAVEKHGQTILLDFSGDQLNPELMMFKMKWTFDYFLNYIKHRGTGLHHRPFGLVIDELAMLSQLDATSSSTVDIFATQIDELLNIWSRQGMIWLTLANQESFQVSPKMFKTLMGCGTIVCGLTSDWESAVYLAQEFMPSQPHRIKRYDPIYEADGTVKHYRQIDMSLDEQLQQNAILFKTLPKFHFLVKEVGNPKLWPLDITTLDPGIYPDGGWLAEVKAMLNERCGVPIPDVLVEIDARQAALRAGALPEPQMKSGAQSDTLEGNEPQPPDDAATDLPPARGADDEFWQER